MKSKKKGILLGVMAFLGVLYFLLFNIAGRGYGYMGYYGYHRGPSFWYFGGPRIFHDPNVRAGSLGSDGIRGGGFGSGK